jgi:UDP-N-acetylmuramyl pentapeptide phosphotransferase/UDP-N-acetylglucosamine-1-phosphate transferase
MPAGQLRALVIAGAAATTSWLGLRALRAAPPAGAALWQRSSHAGRPVSLLEGPAYVAAASLAALPAGPGPVVAAVGGGALGALDDLAGDSGSKGLRGHLGALSGGELTTGAVKVVGLAATGLASAALIDRRDGVGRGHPVETLVGGAVIAGTANVLNLLDLRPGRALKVAVLAAVLTSTGRTVPRQATSAAAAAAGAALGLLRPDLAGETMLGDTGANSAGALLGAALVHRTGLRGRCAGLGVLAALTLASERVSFTTVIESTPGLRELDALGR